MTRVFTVDLPLPKATIRPVNIPSADQSAKAAGLRYVSDEQPGIQRKKWGRGFSYFDAAGDRIQDPNELDRLKALPIPPAWEDVWICPFPNGHLLATGRDARGRKQYRYHPDWRKIRNRTKFDRLIPFGYARPLIREVTDRHLRQHTLSREKLLALVVRLLDATLIRVGNDEYVQQNQSFGLTTLRDRHVELATTKVRFHFSGKSGVEHEVELSDRRLARAIKRCQELPGQQLFQYVDAAGQVHAIDSADVNDYLQDITGAAFTSKDFRTWAGTACTAQVLHELGASESESQAQAHIRTAIETTANHLGNRVPTCRNFYVHPAIPQAYIDGWLLDVWQEAIARSPPTRATSLTPTEQALIVVLERAQPVNSA
jgi:DNA topoisomerase-1